jgi:hypothetical protein
MRPWRSRKKIAFDDLRGLADADIEKAPAPFVARRTVTIAAQGPGRSAGLAPRKTGRIVQDY